MARLLSNARQVKGMRWEKVTKECSQPEGNKEVALLLQAKAKEEKKRKKKRKYKTRE